MIALRATTLADAPAFAALIAEDPAHVALAGPVRPPDATSMAEVASGRALDYAIVVDDEVAGRIRASNLVRGPFQNAYLGYWVAARLCGRGAATYAVGECCRRAFDDHGLHRIQAATRLDNAPSQAVLAKNGFRLEGFARRYLQIDSSFRDHMLWALTAEDRVPVALPQAPAGLVVRLGDERDAAAAGSLLGRVRAEPEAGLLGAGQPDERAERRRLRTLRGSRDGAMLVALLDGRLVGRLDVARDPHPYAAHVAEFGLVVDADVRGQGIGTALVGRLRTWCAEVGISRLEAHAVPANLPSLRFLRRCGLVEEGLRRQRFDRAGEQIDVVVLAGPVG